MKTKSSFSLSNISLYPENSPLVWHFWNDSLLPLCLCHWLWV